MTDIERAKELAETFVPRPFRRQCRTAIAAARYSGGACLDGGDDGGGTVDGMEMSAEHVDVDYINGLSVEDLRRQLIESLDDWYGLMKALEEEVEMAPPRVLNALGGSIAAKYPEDNAKGKELQSIYDDLPADDPRRESGQVRAKRYDIPFRSECEGGAGLWWRIRRGLVAESPSSIS